MENMKETINRLIDIGAQLEKPEQIEICGKTYCTKQLKRYDGPEYATPLTGSTLTGLLDYAELIMPHERGEDDHPAYFIQIESETQVRIMSMLDKEARRETLYQAMAITSDFDFGRWYRQDEFVIALQANFLPSDDLAAVKTVSGNVKAETVATYGDDGTQQRATIKQGVATAVDIEVPNPVELTPYRTFAEVKQPSSSFVFRIQANEQKDSRPEFKLVAADGDHWKLDAIESIRAYLSTECSRRGILTYIIG